MADTTNDVDVMLLSALSNQMDCDEAPGAGPRAFDFDSSPRVNTIALDVGYAEGTDHAPAAAIILSTLLADACLVKPNGSEDGLCYARGMTSAYALCGSNKPAEHDMTPFVEWLHRVDVICEQKDKNNPPTFAQHQLCRNLLSAVQSPAMTESTPLSFGEHMEIIHKGMTPEATAIESFLGSHEASIVLAAARMLRAIDSGQEVLHLLCQGELPTLSLASLSSGRDGFLNWLAALAVTTSLEGLLLSDGARFAQETFAQKTVHKDGSLQHPPVGNIDDDWVCKSGFGAFASSATFNSAQDKQAVSLAFRAVLVLLAAATDGLHRMDLEREHREKSGAYVKAMQKQVHEMFGKWQEKCVSKKMYRPSSLLDDVHALVQQLLNDARQCTVAATVLHAVLFGRVFTCGVELTPLGQEGPTFPCGGAPFQMAWLRFVQSKGLESSAEPHHCISMLEALEFLTGAAAAHGSPLAPQMAIAVVWYGVLAELEQSSTVYRQMMSGSVTHHCNGPILCCRPTAIEIYSRYYDRTKHNRNNVTLNVILGVKSLIRTQPKTRKTNAGSGRREGDVNMVSVSRIRSYTSGAYIAKPSGRAAAARAAASQAAGLQYLSRGEASLNGADRVPSQNSRSFDDVLALGALYYPAMHHFLNVKPEHPLHSIAKAIEPLRPLFHSATCSVTQQYQESNPDSFEAAMTAKDDDGCEKRKGTSWYPPGISIKSKDFASCVSDAMSDMANKVFTRARGEVLRTSPGPSDGSLLDESEHDFERARKYAFKWAGLIKHSSGLLTAIDTWNGSREGVKNTSRIGFSPLSRSAIREKWVERCDYVYYSDDDETQ